MFEVSSSWLNHQDSPLDSSFRNYMNPPINIRQHEVLPASVTPCKVSSTTGFSEFEIPRQPEKGLEARGIDPVKKSFLILPDPRVNEKPWTYKMPNAQERKFLVFDRSGNETRLMYSSLCPRALNLPAKQFDAHRSLPETQVRKAEQVCDITHNFYEESGENVLDEELEMHEDSEEINALLYSNDYDDQDNDNDYDDEDGDEASSGHFPLAKEVVCHKQEERHASHFEDIVSISGISLKRHKALDGGKQNIAHENIDSEDIFSDIDKGTGRGPTIGSKRPRKDKIRATLKALESMLPGLKSKDPVVILDEAINYLKCLKYNAETMSVEHSDTSGCYEPL